MTIIDASRLIIGIGYLILAGFVAYAIRRWAHPWQKPLWYLTGAVLTWWGLQYLMLMIFDPPRTQAWLLQFHVGHWFYFSLFVAWLWTERAKRG